MDSDINYKLYPVKPKFRLSFSEKKLSDNCYIGLYPCE